VPATANSHATAAASRREALWGQAAWLLIVRRCHRCARRG
jgi:hypothetical protein